MNYKKIGNILELHRGYDLPVEQMIEGDILVVGSNGIVGYHNQTRSISPTVTIGRSGSIGKVHYYDNYTWVHNTALYVDDFKGNDPLYIYYILKNLDFENLKSSSVVPSLNRNYIYPMKIPFYENIIDQKNISKLLYSLDQKISLNTRMNAELEAMAKQLYDYWFVQFDFPDENGKPYKSSGGKMVWNEKLKREIPEGWEVGQVGDFANIFTGKKDVSKAVPGKYLFFSCAPEPITSNEYIYDGEAVLVSGNGSYTGRVTYYKGKFDLYQRTYACILKDYCKELYPWFYCYMKYYFQPIYSGGKHGSAIPYIVLSDLTDSIVVFNVNVLAAFSHTMSSILNTFYNNHYRINGSLTHLRDSLLPMLMNGQVTIE